MSDLKEKLIRLGSTNPELRPHLRPILSELETPRGVVASGLSDMVDAYLEAAEFTGDEDWPSNVKFSREAERHAKRACGDFLRKAGDVPEEACLTREDLYAQMGHDLWMTRNGHGVGFWETSDWAEPWASKLTKIAERMGEVWAYVGDDGLIYID